VFRRGRIRALHRPAAVTAKRRLSHTSTSSATARTPYTRFVTCSAAYFCASILTRPTRVTTPSRAVTPICDASTVGSARNSSITSR
jgi:hypothetical protein